MVKKDRTQPPASFGTVAPELEKSRPTDVNIDDSKYRKSGIKDRVLGYVSWEDK
jgi:hypothetical protein